MAQSLNTRVCENNIFFALLAYVVFGHVTFRPVAVAGASTSTLQLHHPCQLQLGSAGRLAGVQDRYPGQAVTSCYNDAFIMHTLLLHSVKKINCWICLLSSTAARTSKAFAGRGQCSSQTEDRAILTEILRRYRHYCGLVPKRFQRQGLSGLFQDVAGRMQLFMWQKGQKSISHCLVALLQLAR